MTKIKLTDGTIINASNVEVVKGVLKITTAERTVEELAALFSDKEKTSLITLMTESGSESGYKTGFTSFSGIIYGADESKTIELFQPVDVTESRIANAEGVANLANEEMKKLATEMTNAQAAMTELTAEITNAQLALCEVYELMS